VYQSLSSAIDNKLQAYAAAQTKYTKLTAIQ
jgi:hypothetical protein